MAKLKLRVLSQNEELLNLEVDSVNLPMYEGEATILPNHIPVFSQLKPGILRYSKDNKKSFIVISKGFVDKDENNQIIIMVDSAVEERDIATEKAKKAIKEAEKIISAPKSKRELILAEAALKQAMLELKLAENIRNKKHFK